MNSIILVMGLPGSGKSYFAARLASEISAVHLQSDIVRKSMHLEGKYTEGDKMLVYEEMCNKAEALLDNGESVIVDATFHLDTFRKIFYKLAAKLTIQIAVIWIESTDTLIKLRMKNPRKYSEADYATYLQLKKDFDPVLHPFLHLKSTNSNIDSMINKAVNYLKIGDDT
ncbi:AAA family ATPase [Algoriphagus persicinus]|uniref:AAA family ATPase n=1 Tax=Algoriphagus persicinus TaxID=3108754 RepID=UPI002B393A3E|nr:AAA family ATPase [Algoriphagus sp. E1-3-M2]MEB2785263.1 AAA family ATPase [Algoriphagus sp. E1-3-M2]